MFRNRYLNIGEPWGLNKSVFIKKTIKGVFGRFGIFWFVVGRCGSLWIVLGRCGSFWVRCGWLWMVVGRFGSFWVVPRFSNYPRGVARCQV